MDATITLELVILLFAVATAAGFVDSIAGGGGLIAMPALLAAGLSPVQALATNKLQGTGGTLSASFYFISKGAVNLRKMRLAIVMTFIGSMLGTLLVQKIDAGVLEQAIPFLLIGIVLYFLFSPRLNSDQSRQVISLSVFSFTAAVVIGFYDGFFGPGTGSFFTIAFVSLLGYSITSATAHTKLLNCISNIASLLFFIIGGHVVWTVGLVMMLGQIIGARLGSTVVLSRGQTLIRPMIVCVSLAMTAKLLWGNYGHLLY
ncbi:TSUP family transporter [Endozoicomonas elysicola]|uniref:Probable membrane transporter protein n=1 Tax=Endozoicomonas elysicola TaxID=305900 RepID=A0A081K9Q3_9GAMM|nr:TSUP family transporter [Endozoicomonas elysicola]KEI70879.1 membrane protein [Endozoicomonas elysicola]